MKVYSRIKRKLGKGTHLRHKKRNKIHFRLKTFKSEEMAKDYAEKKGIKDYELVNLRSEDSRRKKIKIIVK